MKLARDVKRGDTSFELKVPAREKEKAAKFDKSEDMFNRVLEGVAQIMLMREYERAGKGSIVVNSFIWSGDWQEIETRMGQVAEEFCGNYFRYLIKAINKRQEKVLINLPDREYEESTDFYGSSNPSRQNLPSGLLEELNAKFGDKIKAEEWIGEEVRRYTDEIDRPCTVNALKTTLTIPVSIYEETLKVFQKYYPDFLVSLAFNNISNFSDVAIIMDKDGTVTKINEAIDNEILDTIIELLYRKVHIAILTGGIIEHGLSNFIEPIENKLRTDGLQSLFPYLTYYFMSGNGKLTWDNLGNRKIRYCGERFSGSESLIITAALAEAFFETVAVKFSLDINGYKQMIAQAQSAMEIQAIFDNFTSEYKDKIGVSTINNGNDRFLILELKNSKEKQSVEVLQNTDFVSKVYKRFQELIGDHKFGVNFVQFWGSTFIYCSLRDKETTLNEFISEKEFVSPLVVGFGDSANDYGFLGASMAKGNKLSFLVGEPGKEGLALPENINVCKVKGPDGTREILKNILAALITRGNHLQHFGSSSIQSQTYAELSGSFVDELEVVLELNKEQNARFSGIGKGFSQLSAVLNSALLTLEELVATSNDEALQQYLRQILGRVDNRAPPITIKVSSKLLTDAARYYNPKAGTAEIIFNETFIQKSLSLPQEQASLMLAIRLFHELGHTKFINQYQMYREEYELSKRDAQLYALFSSCYTDVQQYYPQLYAKMLKALIEQSQIINDFDEVITALEVIEQAQRDVYNARSTLNLDDPAVFVARNNRIEQAFQKVDPEFFGNSPAKRLGKVENINGTFLGAYRDMLNHRGIAAGRESFFFLNNQPLGRIPFSQLKSPRVRCAVNADWKRQYFALHKGRRFSDAIGVTVAEDKPAYVQMMHSHPTVERTMYLCRNKGVILAETRKL
jgi:hydroxymethylpyrimidine pyrophosphatase-like HAD family hydrolase